MAIFRMDFIVLTSNKNTRNFNILAMATTHEHTVCIDLDYLGYLQLICFLLWVEKYGGKKRA